MYLTPNSYAEVTSIPLPIEEVHAFPFTKTINYLPGSVVVYNFSALSHSAQAFVSLCTKDGFSLSLTSIQFPIHGLIAAQPRSPTVANMNINTTASSFLESLSIMTH